MPHRKAPGISFGTTKGVSEIAMSYIFKRPPTKFESYFVEFEVLTAMKVNIMVFWDAPRVV
jgi:hypothetical protein